MELWSKLRNLDAYPKVNEDFYSRTLSGGLITILSSLAILLLFFSEIRMYHPPSSSRISPSISRLAAAELDPICAFFFGSVRNESRLWWNELCVFSYYDVNWK